MHRVLATSHSNCVANLDAKLYLPRFCLFSTLFDNLRANIHPSLLSIHSGGNSKMLRVSKDSNSSFTRSFNPHDSSLNTNESSSTPDSFNITIDDRSEILAWLSPLEPRVRHRDIGARRVDSIGAWVLETEEFRRWHNGSSEGGSYYPTLFCGGSPGVGKSYVTYEIISPVTGNLKLRLLIGCDDSSLVIDKLCDEATQGDHTIACFYFDFAARNEQSPVNMLGSLLRQVVPEQEEIPEAIVRDFQEIMSIGGRGLQVSGILKMFQAITASRPTFICVDALDECMPKYLMVVLESLGQILRGSPNTRIFMTGRPHVLGEVGKEFGGAATVMFIRATEDGVFKFLREKLRNDTIPDMMSGTLEEDIMKSIPAMSSETYVGTRLRAKLPQATR